MSRLLNRILAAAFGVLLLLLASRGLPPNWDQYLYQTILLLISAAILVESAVRQRLFITDRIHCFAAAGFAIALILSFFISDMDKYEISAATLNRILWLAALYCWPLIFTQDPAMKRCGISIIAIGFVLMAWRTFRIEGDEIVRLAGSAGVGVAACIAGWVVRSPERPPELRRNLFYTLLAAVLIAGAWAGVTQIRLNDSEIELVRNNRQTEQALVSVTRRCFQENWLVGAGSGSMHRKFLQYRPVDATLRGVPDKLDAPIQAGAILSGETGVLGLISFLFLVASPVGFMGKSHPPLNRAILLGLYGIFITHEILGGAWILTHFGGLILFALVGMLISDPAPENEKSVPASFYFACLSLIGGILLLQHIYWTKSREIVKLTEETRIFLAAGKLDDAITKVDYALGVVDPHQNELLSLMVGGFNKAGLLDQALKNSHLLLRRDPDYPSVKNNIGTFYVAIGKPAEAIPYMKEMTAKHPTTENFSKMGHLYLLTGNIPEAAKMFSEALNLFPREIDIFTAKSSYTPDSIAEGNITLEAGAFSANNLLRMMNPQSDPAARQQFIENYNSQSGRLKTILGMSSEPSRQN